MTFKGTTLKDLKWARKLEKIKSFGVKENSIFYVVFKNGREFEFGVVTDACTGVIKSNLNELYIPS